MLKPAQNIMNINILSIFYMYMAERKRQNCGYYKLIFTRPVSLDRLKFYLQILPLNGFLGLNPCVACTSITLAKKY